MARTPCLALMGERVYWKDYSILLPVQCHHYVWVSGSPSNSAASTILTGMPLNRHGLVSVWHPSPTGCAVERERERERERESARLINAWQSGGRWQLFFIGFILPDNIWLPITLPRSAAKLLKWYLINSVNKAERFIRGHDPLLSPQRVKSVQCQKWNEYISHMHTQTQNTNTHK